MIQGQKITPNLWFDHNAKEAVQFYVSIFPNSEVLDVSYYPSENLPDFQKDLAGKELTVEFNLSGQHFTAINAGPEFKFSEAISFAVTCKDQDEIDYFWSKLSAVQDFEQCGWCKDKYGLSWQIVPENMGELMTRPGAYEKLMHMKKLIIAEF